MNKYFGRSDFKEGNHIPFGFHWGFITPWSQELYVIEAFISLHIKVKDRGFIALCAWGSDTGRGYTRFYKEPKGLPF